MIKISENDTQRYKDILKDRVIELKGEKNIAEWCRKHGIPRTTAQCWIEKRSLPSIEYYAALAKEFGVSIDYLVGLED
ncbi:MAG: helix-turn-helix domain containing protein [Firmicutes bacterium]|nr:helix-turn-helix domain containing protein [Bacillota bacterium]